MTVRSKPEKDVSARQRLLAAALELFNRKGYAPTTVREIVETAAVTKPVLYYYFGNKEGIYLELLHGPLLEFERLLTRAAEEKGTSREKIVALCDRVFVLFEKNVSLVRLMNAIYYGPPQGAPFVDIDSFHTKFQELVRALITRGMRAREIRRGRPEDAMWAVLGALNIAMEIELCHPEMAIGRKGLRRILDAVFEGLGSSQEPGKRKKP